MKSERIISAFLLFSDIKVTQVNNELRAEVTCTGGLYGTDERRGNRMTLNSWFREAHHLGRKKAFGDSSGIPARCRPAPPSHRLRIIHCAKASPFARSSLPEMSHGNQEDVSRLFLVNSPLVMTEGTLQHSLPKKALEALLQGDRDEAIKQVLLEAKVSREEATQMVADFLLTQPSLLRRMKDTQSETKWGLMRWLILLQAIAVAIGYFLFFRDQW